MNERRARKGIADNGYCYTYLVQQKNEGAPLKLKSIFKII